MDNEEKKQDTGIKPWTTEHFEGCFLLGGFGCGITILISLPLFLILWLAFGWDPLPAALVSFLFMMALTSLPDVTEFKDLGKELKSRESRRDLYKLLLTAIGIYALLLLFKWWLLG